MAKRKTNPRTTGGKGNSSRDAGPEKLTYGIMINVAVHGKNGLTKEIIGEGFALVSPDVGAIAELIDAEAATVEREYLPAVLAWFSRRLECFQVGLDDLDRTALRRREREVIATSLPRVRRIQEKTLGRLQQLEVAPDREAKSSGEG